MIVAKPYRLIEISFRQLFAMEQVFIHHTATVEDGAIIGEGSKIWHYAHVRKGARLGKFVIVGKSSYIDTNVQIGNNVKIQNLVSIYDGVTLANDIFVGPHVAFTNDLYPKAKGEFTIVKTMVEDGVSIGANATIICGITLHRHCLIAAGSVVTSDVIEHSLVAGNPARRIGWVCKKCAHRLDVASQANVQVAITCTNCSTTNTFQLTK